MYAHPLLLSAVPQTTFSPSFRTTPLKKISSRVLRASAKSFALLPSNLQCCILMQRCLGKPGTRDAASFQTLLTLSILLFDKRRTRVSMEILILADWTSVTVGVCRLQGCQVACYLATEHADLVSNSSWNQAVAFHSFSLHGGRKIEVLERPTCFSGKCDRTSTLTFNSRLSVTNHSQFNMPWLIMGRHDSSFDVFGCRIAWHIAQYDRSPGYRDCTKSHLRLPRLGLRLAMEDLTDWPKHLYLLSLNFCATLFAISPLPKLTHALRVALCQDM